MSIRKLVKKMLPDRLLKIYRNKRDQSISNLINYQQLYDKGALRMFMDESNYYSQYGQDFFLDKIVFGERKNGFFVDIGGNHPKSINNTYYFEIIGWDGIAFEPQKELYDLWNKRRTKCFNYALGSQEGMVKFAQGEAGCEGGSGIKGYADKNAELIGEKIKYYDVKQRKLSNVLKEEGIKHIDFISMDVEGYELEILKGIDFNNVDISCILFENNKLDSGKPDMRIREYLVKRGYRFVARIMCDDVFMKKIE